MTPNKELRNRMVVVASALRIDRPFSSNVMSEAIAELDLLTAENERLREALDHALMTFAETSNLTIEERAQRMADTLAEALEQP